MYYIIKSKKTVITIYVLMISSISIAQDTLVTKIAPQQPSVAEPTTPSVATKSTLNDTLDVEINNKNKPVNTEENNEILNRIKNIDSHINAINTKIAYINSDELRKANAEKEGWFSQMEQIKKELLDEKNKLIKKSLAK